MIALWKLDLEFLSKVYLEKNYLETAENIHEYILGMISQIVTLVEILIEKEKYKRAGQVYMGKPHLWRSMK